MKCVWHLLDLTSNVLHRNRAACGRERRDRAAPHSPHARGYVLFALLVGGVTVSVCRKSVVMVGPDHWWVLGDQQ